MAPRPGSKVLLAGEPRLVAKLQPAVARRGPSPRAGQLLFVQGDVETTPRPPRPQAVTMWTRPADRAPSYGPCGEGMDKCGALAHPFPTLGALAPTSASTTILITLESKLHLV